MIVNLLITIHDPSAFKYRTIVYQIFITNSFKFVIQFAY